MIYNKWMFVIYILLINGLFVKSSKVIGVGNDSYFYDLSNDYYESNDLLYDDNYTDIISFLNDRILYWQSLYKSPEYPDSTNEETAYQLANGIVPYNTIDYDPIDIEIKYDNISNQPNIVFILIDDWGYNDVGFRSTMMSWTTPTIDSLKENGILLTNYYTYEFCVPSRGSLLTGRFVVRLGLETDNPASELPLDEVTLAQELKSAGYRTNIVGKWHLGYSTYYHLPNQRGFDYQYGYLNAQENYWTKSVSDNGTSYVDLMVNGQLVTDPDELSSSLHSGFLLQSKAEEVIKNHAKEFNNQPMFLYYAMQLIHIPFEAPDRFISRCEYPESIVESYGESTANNTQKYCAMNLMVDEAITNLTCVLKETDMLDNTIIIISGDNGGVSSIQGDSYPFRGYKHSFWRGGVSNTAIIHGPTNWIPESKQGTAYDGQVHITDWFPTIMGLATNGSWTGSYGGVDIDGVDMWSSILNNDTSLHHEIVFLLHDNSSVIQYDMNKLMINVLEVDVIEPLFIFNNDLDPTSSQTSCTF